MTDKELEQKALEYQSRGYTWWSCVADLIDEAVSKATKEFIHSIAVSMYHREEAACGMI